MSFVAISWLFFRVARSSRIDLDMIVGRALKNSQLTCGERHAYFGDRTLVLVELAAIARATVPTILKCFRREGIHSVLQLVLV